MREIKFRAWVKEDNEMKGCMIPHDSPELNYSELIDTHNENGHTILMQYTGLKDKNGVEIYESDILVFDLTETNKSNPTVIEWEVGGFKYATMFQYGYTCEVIGNIYQNPELLNK